METSWLKNIFNVWRDNIDHEKMRNVCRRLVQIDYTFDHQEVQSYFMGQIACWEWGTPYRALKYFDYSGEWESKDGLIRLFVKYIREARGH